MEAFFAHKDAYPALTIAFVALCTAAIFVSHFWYKARRAEMELALKQSMVERGMSATDICSVIDAGASGKPDTEEDAQLARHSRIRA
jgi:hypothetical protein